MYNQLNKIISNYISPNQEDIDLINSLFRFEAIEKGTSIIETGRYTDKVFFINSGYLRYYKILDSGEDQTIHLYVPNTFAASLKGFFLKQKAEEELQSLTDCELLYITKPDLDKLYSTNTQWQYFERKLLEDFLIEKEQKIIDQLSLTAQERYMKLLKTNPEIIQNVPVKYIASFLGIQPESLSRIKGQIS